MVSYHPSSFPASARLHHVLVVSLKRKLAKGNSRRQRKRLFRRFAETVQRMGSMSSAWRKAVIAAGFAVFLGFTHVHAQTTLGPFEKQRRAFNPLPEPIDQYIFPVPHVVDFDGDNDFDLLVGSAGGDVELFINEGGRSTPRFSPARELGSDPFASIFVGLNSSPAMFDFDGDSDLDLFVGSNGSKVRYYRNDGGVFTEQTGAWNATTKAGNPLDDFNNLQGARISFVDFDNNSGTGIQVFIGGSAFTPFPQFRHYRDVASSLVQEPFSLPGTVNAEVQPAFTFGDLDGDGDKDAVVGGAGGGTLRYLRNSGDNVTFIEVTDSTNPFENFFFESYATPQVVDWDNDGDLDAIVGETISDDPKTAEDETSGQIYYLENTGSATAPNFIPRIGLANPLSGIFTQSNGRVAVGNFLNNGTRVLMTSGVYYDGFEEAYVSINRFYSLSGGNVQPITNPFSSLLGSGELAYPIDFDKDGDIDLFSLTDGFSYYHVYDQASGTYSSPPGHPLTTLPDLPPLEYPLSFTDLDNDNDWDIAYNDGSGGFRYLKNTGTSASASFILASGAENLLQGLPAPNGSGIQFVDVDGDGDLDVFTDSSDPDQVFFHENTGTSSSPIFGAAIDLFPTLRETQAQCTFTDYDNDGDLDVLAGTAGGVFKYLINTNPPPTVNGGTGETQVQGGSASFVSISPALVLADGDSDQIVSATVQVIPYESGKDVFAFTAPVGSGISGSFDGSTGRFTLTGKASVAVYQQALRAIQYRYTGTSAGGRGAQGRSKNLNRTFVFSVRDIDRTNAIDATQVATIVFATNQAPSITADITSVLSQQSAVVSVTFNDPDGNLDPSTFRVVTPPGSGAQVSFSNGNLVIDYTGIAFVGTESFVIEICDLLGACTQATLTVTVQGEIVVYNAISADGNTLNEFLRIPNIEVMEPQNRVTVFSRWGDKVFEVENYDNSTRRFEGINDHGKKLPAGTYFYRVVFTSGREPLTGYLLLKN